MISVDDDGNLNGLDSQLEAIKKDNGFCLRVINKNKDVSRSGVN